jgi:HlyD family secretion protein
MKRLLILAAVVAAALGVGGILLGRSGASSHTVTTVTGSIEATEVEVASQVGGRIVEIPVPEGQTVKQGQAIVVLDDREAQLHVDELRARIAIANAELADLLAKPREAELDVQMSRIHEADVQLAAARSKLTREQELAQRHAAPAADVVDADFSVRAAVQRAETERRSFGLMGAPPRTTLQDVARARLGELEAQLHLAELQVERAHITAPCDGVVARRHHEPGEIVAAGAPLLTVIDPAHLWVELSVPERLHGQLAVGDPATVAVEAGDATVAGHVSYLAERHLFTPRNVQTREERALLSFRAKVAIDGAPRNLKPGMYVDVTFGAAPGR